MANGDGYRKIRLGMRGCSLLASLILLTLLLQGCPGVDVAPAPVSSAATASGSSTTNSGTAMLSWDAPTTDTDSKPIVGLAGYHIYVGTNPDDMTLRGGVSGAESTDFEITGLGSGTFYFAVTAYDSDGEESAKSNLGSKTF